MNGRVVVKPGKVIEEGHVVVRDGLIQAVGQEVEIPPDAVRVDAKGLTVYPGFIDAATTGFVDDNLKVEPVAGRNVDFRRYVLAATRPDNRRLLTPEFALYEHLKTDDGIDTVRKSGFTSLHVVPSGRIAAGTGAIISASDVPLRELLLEESSFSVFRLYAPGGSNYPNTLMGATAHLRQAFLDARRHARHEALFNAKAPNIPRPPSDPALEALGKVIAQERRPLFVASSRDDIHRALDFCRDQEISPVIAGGDEAYRCLERLAATKTAVVLELDFGEEPKIEKPAASDKLVPETKPPLRVQQDKLDRWREKVRGLRDLHAKGIPFAYSSRGLKNRSEVFKNLRKAIEAGLPREAALAGLTISAADILGLEDRLGTLEPGKLAHMTILTGPFDHKRTKVRYVFVDGHKFEYNESAKPVSDSPEPDQELTLDGDWTLTIESANGPVKADISFARKKNSLSGTFESEEGNGSIASGSVKDRNVEFVVAIGAGARTVKLTFSGELKDDRLTGTLKSAFGAPTKWSGERVEPEPNPVTLAVDDEKPEAESAPAQPTELESDRLKRPLDTGGNVLIKNGTVLTGTGETLAGTSILVRKGKIAAIGKDLEPDEGMAVIDASGRFVMPGIIDTHSHIMITGGVNESTQSIVPEVSVRDVVNTADVREYRALAGGTTAARLFHGSANVIGGQDAVVKLKYGATAAEHILHDAPQGVKFALGENVKFRTTRFPNTRMGVEATLNRAFLEAVDYRRAWREYERRVKENPDQKDVLLPPRRDLRLEALADIVNHEKFIHSHCYRADEILMLLRVASNLGIRVWSLQHVLEGYKIAPEIVAHGASCSTFADWWAYKVEAYDATPYNAALLEEAGANVVIKSDNSELMRHLYLEAAKPVRYGGMHPDDALQTVTRNPARELGLDDRMGTIEVGKDADFAIFNGHPLNAFARCEQTIIDGELLFDRSQQPTAMSEDAEKASSRPRELVFPPEEIRQRELKLAESASGRYAIRGGTLHPVDAPAIEGGTLLVEDGRIAALGTDVAVPTDTEIIDAGGLHVYPGLIDAGTTLGLTEIGKVRETSDYSETGGLQPDLRAGIAINPDSELIPVARAGGITSILVRPTGGTIAGQASLVKLAGWTAPEMVREYEAGLQINWPRNDNQVEALREFLEEGREYHRLVAQSKENGRQPPISDPRLKALGPYLAGEKPVFIEADSRERIAEALLFAEKEKLKIVITGGTEAWKLADELKKRDVPVIVGPVMRQPLEGYDPFDAPYANPGRLHEAGVRFCIRSDSASNSRNAPFEAAMAVAYGLPEEAALRAVTLSAAEVLGIDDEVGSLTPGKTANLVISDGSPLRHTAQIKGIFVDGKPFRPESRQTRFYKRYRRRLQEHRAKTKTEPTTAEGALAP